MHLCECDVLLAKYSATYSRKQRLKHFGTTLLYGQRILKKSAITCAQLAQHSHPPILPIFLCLCRQLIDLVYCVVGETPWCVVSSNGGNSLPSPLPRPIGFPSPRDRQQNQTEMHTLSEPPRSPSSNVSPTNEMDNCSPIRGTERQRLENSALE